MRLRPLSWRALIAALPLGLVVVVLLCTDARRPPSEVTAAGAIAVPFDSAHAAEANALVRCLGRDPAALPRDLRVYRVPAGRTLRSEGRAVEGLYHASSRSLVIASAAYWPVYRHELVHALGGDAAHADPVWGFARHCDFL